MAVYAMLFAISMTYIREYTQLSPKEQRQLSFKRQYKHTHPEWDDSMVLLTRLVILKRCCCRYRMRTWKFCDR
jgi:hypothetical protein